MLPCTQVLHLGSVSRSPQTPHKVPSTCSCHTSDALGMTLELDSQRSATISARSRLSTFSSMACTDNRRLLSTCQQMPAPGKLLAAVPCAGGRCDERCT
eukprot:359094-Chlamydomonas_euryale.AAC.6